MIAEIQKEYGRIVISRPIPFVKGDKFEQNWVSTNGLYGYKLVDGWNNSYHDAWYFPELIAWGKGKRKFRLARRAYKLGLAKVKESEERRDSSTERMRLKYAVRLGD